MEACSPTDARDQTQIENISAEKYFPPGVVYFLHAYIPTQALTSAAMDMMTIERRLLFGKPARSLPGLLISN
jgi:hypothetical protein